MIRFGAMNSPLHPVVSEIEEISRLGFDYVEVTMDAPQAHHLLLRERMDDVVATLRRVGLGLVCHLPTFVSAADLTPALRDASVAELLDSLATARDMGAEKVVLHPAHGQGLGRRAPDLVRGYIMESLDTVLSRAGSLGLRVVLENMTPGSLSLTEPEDFDAVLAQYPTLEMTLDLGHAHIGTVGEDRNLAFIQRHGGRIGHVHASDNRGREDDHLPVGAGSVDFPLLMDALKRIGYKGTLTLEVFSPDRDYLVRSREKLAAMLAPGG
ncbi:MAG: sugar phosphate isomerase/epimerase [Deltaproteobacteria bacterium]|nr:sugar phosphate isomerase/epimerase [Deltaproteobacteria bacterium]